ncbi:OsmC family protein [Yoonia sediminilitoris]|uniref:Putative OsmC-like protein n=1 Tax=Yoonia sediminilitoris TaxID=1286148 RepID=A0A2T6KC38_9RHOB|nr:OsmC family protein [Yoonia sediminilitoris]PUB12464.1 putative OsmC-like protein [Yoonia sediminilitoris]RCW93158.1 putative OsmC-like protein [Yoonia sediminilitoris]
MTETTTAPGLNNVEIGRVISLAEKISSEPHVAATTWRAEVRWDSGFRSSARVRDFDPAHSDEPEQLGGTNTGPNPVEQLLAALGNCLAVGYAANATAAGIEIRDMTIDVEGDLDLHTFLGLREGHAGFSGIKVRVNLDSEADAEALRLLHEKVIGSSPVGHTLSRAIPLDIALA